MEITIEKEEERMKRSLQFWNLLGSEKGWKGKLRSGVFFENFYQLHLNVSISKFKFEATKLGILLNLNPEDFKAKYTVIIKRIVNVIL